MKNIITQLGMLSVVALMLGSCAKGPSGPDPGSELVITYPIGNIGQTETLRKTCDFVISGDTLIISGDTVRFGSSYTRSSRYNADDMAIEFMAPLPGDVTPLTPAVIELYFGSSIPSAGTTQSWTGVNFFTGTLDFEVERGPIISFGGATYYAVEGETTFKTVVVEGGRIVNATGFFNGKLKSFIGREITVESAVFHHPTP